MGLSVGKIEEEEEEDALFSFSSSFSSSSSSWFAAGSKMESKREDVVLGIEIGESRSAFRLVPSPSTCNDSPESVAFQTGRTCLRFPFLAIGLALLLPVCLASSTGTPTIDDRSKMVRSTFTGRSHDRATPIASSGSQSTTNTSPPLTAFPKSWSRSGVRTVSPIRVVSTTGVLRRSTTAPPMVRVPPNQLVFSSAHPMTSALS
mmetsp:Transcript_7145/g.17940  ORF Transcript_7145/g.17940 Transcript_7145/m.17940 type:complete len:204 (+) Transcript_7145:587-1198(+)